MRLLGAPPVLTVNRSAGRTSFPLSNETEIEESQEENGMDNGAQATDLRRLDKARAQERHRNAGQVEIERVPALTKKALQGTCTRPAMESS
jgi:hypothetical protein